MFGHSGVEVAPYEVLEKEDALELRHYERLVLVTTAMPTGMHDQRVPFYKLFFEAHLPSEWVIVGCFSDGLEHTRQDLQTKILLIA